MNDRRLELFRSLQALARTGQHFCRDEYDRERYEQVEHIAAELLAGGARVSAEELRQEWALESGLRDARRSKCVAPFFAPTTARSCWSARPRTACGRCRAAGRT